MSDGGGIGGGAPLGGGGGGGRDVALPDGGTMRNYEPPSHLDRSSDPANRRKTSRGFPGDRDSHDEDRPRDEADRKGKRKRDIARSVDKGTESAKRDASSRAARRAAVDPTDTSVAPGRFNAAAKEAWSQAPAEVRSEAHRAVRELEHGLSVYHQRAVRDSQLDQWHNLAASAGISVPQYLQTALSVEMALTSQDAAQKLAGLEHCCRLAGVSPAQYSHYILNESDAQRQQRATSMQMSNLQGQVSEVGRQTANVAFSQLQSTVHQHISSTVTGFASAVGHDHFEELSLDVAAAIRSDPDQSGSTEDRLQRAWQRVTGKRRAGKSISGSPANGTNPALPARRKGERSSISDSIDRARARLGG